ncbi:MAG: PH domain-containing protein [Planctomycetaceae bacterium]|jgi:membrane protein YdbS with pleckstrin-like domain|nr:PH domain-containing protein [Planctomycetaceae bacterium]
MTQEQENIHPSDTAASNPASEPLDLKWTYSGKAMRGQFILYWFVTLALLAAGIYFSLTGKLGAAYPYVWMTITALLAILWIYYGSAYVYRTRTIRYNLTETRLYSEKGLFTKTSDTMELVYIEDAQLKQTLLDRIFNGGVGRLTLYSSADQTTKQLIISGIENPKFIFQQLDLARTKVRAKRAILSNG